ncbi:uncharacterized protein ACBT44_004301 isoform 1-T1 [Syngnathus typhle]
MRSLMHDWPRLARGLPGQGMGRAPACTERDRAAPTRPGRGQAEDESNTGRSRPGPWPVTSGDAARPGGPSAQPALTGRLLGQRIGRVPAPRGTGPERETRGCARRRMSPNVEHRPRGDP